jgi:hypothetical protein
MLAKRSLELAAQLIARDEAPTSIERGGRKAHAMHLYGGAQGDELETSSGGDLGAGSKRPSYRLYAKITASDATPCQALGEGIDLIIMASGKSQ